MTKKPQKPAAARGETPAPALPPAPPLAGAGEGVSEARFALPDDVDDGQVVMHDDFRQIVLDGVSCFYAVRVLMGLLRGQAEVGLDGLNAPDLKGLAVLLESVHNRLELVVDGLVATAVQLGLPDARELG